MIDDDVDDVDVTGNTERLVLYTVIAVCLGGKSRGVQIRVNTTCRNYGGVRTPRTPMDRRH